MNFLHGLLSYVEQLPLPTCGRPSSEDGITTADTVWWLWIVKGALWGRGPRVAAIRTTRASYNYINRRRYSIYHSSFNSPRFGGWLAFTMRVLVSAKILTVYVIHYTVLKSALSRTLIIDVLNLIVKSVNSVNDQYYLNLQNKFQNFNEQIIEFYVNWYQLNSTNLLPM